MKDPWLTHTGRHIALLVVLMLLLVGYGTAGFFLVAHYTPVEALYMTVITLSTVGYGEVRPLDENGRLFAVTLIIMGAIFVAYNLAYFTQLLMDGNLLEVYRRRKLRKKLEQLSEHYIVCGYGQMGQIIVQELLRHNLPVVVVEGNDSVVFKLREKGILYLDEDATEEESLLAAGIMRAKGLISVVSKDTDNVFIVLTARDLNRNVQIFARAGAPEIEKRLFKAGADRVVSPFSLGATRIAHNVIRPTVTDFLELALSGEGMELSMEEICIPPEADLVGKQLMRSGIRSDFNLIVVAIKRRDGTMIYNPSPQEVLHEGDILVTIGPQENLSRFGGILYGCSYPTIRPCKS